MLYHRNLPHIQPQGGTFFITYSLHGTIPKQVLEQLQNDYENDKLLLENSRKQANQDLQSETQDEVFKQLRYQLQKKYFGKFDNFLDTTIQGNHWMLNDAVAEIVQNSIFWGRDHYYNLWVSCIMSNHVHLLLTLKPEAPALFKVLQNIKSYSAVQANKLLNRSGKFWHNESYDHIVRNNEEFEGIMRYILNNPIKAQLVENWQDYKWTYSI